MPKPTKPANVTHSSIEEFVACNPMDHWPDKFCLLTKVGNVEVSATSHADCRGLCVTIEESAERIQELAFMEPVAIRNAVYAVVNAMGEPMRFTGVVYEPELPPWYEFAAERQDEEV